MGFILLIHNYFGTVFTMENLQRNEIQEQDLELKSRDQVRGEKPRIKFLSGSLSP
jgi:hypothetical protein